MPLPEGTKLRNGDVVAIHAKVKFDFNPADDDRIHLDVPGSSYCMVTPDEIVVVVRRAFRVGETVKVSGMVGTATVEAVSNDGEFLWLRMSSGCMGTVRSTEATLAEPEGESHVYEF